MTENRPGVNELLDFLSDIHGLSPEDMSTLSVLATAWHAQAELEQLTRERYDTLIHAKTVEANALMPTRSLEDEDIEEFKKRRRAFAMKLAEKRIIEWAFSEFNTLDLDTSDPTPLLVSKNK